MNCQHCNEELNNKRAKNCPDCSQILQGANTRGVYSFVMEAIAQARSDGLSGADVRNEMNAALKAGNAKRAQWAAEYRERQARRLHEESERIRNYRPDVRDEEDLDREAWNNIPRGDGDPYRDQIGIEESPIL